MRARRSGDDQTSTDDSAGNRGLFVGGEEGMRRAIRLALIALVVERLGAELSVTVVVS
jgi:hypothetical protein